MPKKTLSAGKAREILRDTQGTAGGAMRAVAFVWAFNEQDVIGHVARHLWSQGVAIKLFDNWSTDETVKIACCPTEQWPPDEPAFASWTGMLMHTEQEARRIATNLGEPFWAIHHDADEIRRSPVEGERLIDFFNRVARAGWNAVDHRVTVYAPRDGYDWRVHDPETYFSEPLRDHLDDKNGQIKAWIQTPDVRVDLASSGGHKVQFPGRKVCPEKLILRHYPMRGAEQRAAKAKSRAERWDPKERAMGWHCAYETA